jgi:dihydrofolate reductase
MVSLDGFFEGPNRELDWVIVDEELHTYINDQQSAIDTYLYGRRMYEVMAKYWPTADTNSSAPQYVIEFAHIWKNMPKLVFSTTLDKVGWNSRLVRGNIAEEVMKLKALPGKDLSLGGADLASTLMHLGLIDEYQLFVQPIVLGSGTRLFPLLDEKINLRLVEAVVFASGVVLLRYQRADEAQQVAAQ